MKALVTTGTEASSGVEIREVAVPRPGPGQLLVRVRAAGLNLLDVVRAARAEPTRTLGIDFAGTVGAVGEGVSRFAIGDEVAGVTFSAGTVAEYTLVDDGSQVCHRPADLSAGQAAALPTPLMTAAGLASAVGTRGDQTLLLVGAGGAVASFFLQLVRHAGFHILGTGKPGAVDRLRRLGVAEIIGDKGLDIGPEVRRRSPAGVDVAIDLAHAGDALTSTAAAVRDGGRLLSTLHGKSTFERDITATYVEVDDGFDQFAGLVGKAAKGNLEVSVQTYRFADSVAAFDAFATHRTEGRTVVLI